MKRSTALTAALLLATTGCPSTPQTVNDTGPTDSSVHDAAVIAFAPGSSPD